MVFQLSGRVHNDQHWIQLLRKPENQWKNCDLIFQKKNLWGQLLIDHHDERSKCKRITENNIYIYIYKLFRKETSKSSFYSLYSFRKHTIPRGSQLGLFFFFFLVICRIWEWLTDGYLKFLKEHSQKITNRVKTTFQGDRDRNRKDSREIDSISLFVLW